MAGFAPAICFWVRPLVRWLVAGSAAKDRDDYLGYNKKTGVLWYDADGSGKGKAVEVAKLSKGLAIKYTDFFIV